ncbi:MAG: beta-ketoacyl synthase [Phycisphaerae bacterium]
MAEPRVAITGLGVVTPAGVGAPATWESLMAGKSAVKGVDLFDASAFPSRIGGQLDGFSANAYVPKTYRKSVKVMARDIQIAVAAADLAFRDSGIVTRGIDPDRTTIDSRRLGCNIGAGLICSDLDELGAAVATALEDGKFSFRLWGATGMNNLTPLWLLKYLPNMLSCHVTIIHGAEGPSNCITCGDASGQMAIGEAARYISRGAADAAIAGGAESKLNPMGLLRQALLKRLCTGRNDEPAAACRPFDKGHDGTVIAEGGGLVIVEDMDRAKSRGAKLYAEVVGFGGACDPGGIDVLTANAGGLDLAVAKAVADAGIEPSDVGLIVAHGTGVAQEDRREAAAWKKALGPSAAKIPAMALTGATGTMFAGHGGVAVAMAAMAIREQVVPPTANFSSPDDGCELNFSDKPRPSDIKYVVCGSFTVGGQSGAVVLKDCRL